MAQILGTSIVPSEQFSEKTIAESMSRRLHLGRREQGMRTFSALTETERCIIIRWWKHSPEFVIVILVSIAEIFIPRDAIQVFGRHVFRKFGNQIVHWDAYQSSKNILHNSIDNKEKSTEINK